MLTGWGLPARAAFTFTPQARAAYADLLTLRLDRARARLSHLQRTDPDNALPYYLGNYADVLELLITEDSVRLEQLAPLEDRRLDRLRADPAQDDPYYRFAQAEVKLQWAFVYLKLGRTWQAGWRVRQAYLLLKENEAAFPDFVPNQKSLGLLRVVLGAVPEKYQWLLGLFGMRGDLPRGMKQLRRAARADTPYQTEARLFEQLVDLYVLPNQEVGINRLSQLYEKRADYLTVRFFYAFALLRNRRAEAALAVLQDVPADTAYFPLPHLDYLTGEALLCKQQYGRAATAFERFGRHYQGATLRKDLEYQLFLAHWLGGRSDEARLHLRRIETVGDTRSDADRRAQRFAEAGRLPNRALMRARLAYDGGYYDTAEALLAALSAADLPPSEKTEYYYRAGRLAHAQGDTATAQGHYLRTLQLGEGQPAYFAPNAALQLGYLRLSAGDTATARAYFERTLRHPDHPYKNSLDQKARAALSALPEP